MLAVVSSKRTPLTIVLPLVMTPGEAVGPLGAGGPLGAAGPVGGAGAPPPHRPQAARSEAASAPRSAVRNASKSETGTRAFMMVPSWRTRRRSFSRPQPSYRGRGCARLIFVKPGLVSRGVGKTWLH